MGRREAERLAGVLRAAPAPRRWRRPTGRPAVIRAAAADQVRSSVAQVARARAVLDVEGREVQPVLGGRGDARLVAPWKATICVGGGAGVGLVLAAERVSAPGGGGHAADSDGREQRAARQGHRYPESAFAGASDSGSARASITTLRRRTWGLRSSV